VFVAVTGGAGDAVLAVLAELPVADDAGRALFMTIDAGIGSVGQPRGKGEQEEKAPRMETITSFRLDMSLRRSIPWRLDARR
jgi:hypothetical protein